MTGAPTSRQGFWRETFGLVFSALSLVRAGGWRLGGVLLISQLIILGVSLPLFQWLFRSALRAAGMTGLDLGQLSMTGTIPLTVGLIALICVLALWLVSLQFTALIVVLERAQNSRAHSLQGLGRDLTRVVRKLVHPTALPLIGYLFFLLPLAGFGFVSLLTQGISIPLFITGELQKTTVGLVIFAIFLVIIGTANLRLALTLPTFVLTQASSREATKTSRQLMRGLPALRLLAAVMIVSFIASVLAALLTALMLAPTILTDAIAPHASPIAAAYSLGVAQVVGAVLTGFITAWISAILVQLLRARRNEIAHEWIVADVSAAPPTRRSDRTWAFAVSSIAFGAAVLLGTANLAPMQSIARAPDTLVLAHRGFTLDAVENTLSSLRAAAEIHVDLVEMDVMQAKDGGFVAMHDISLGRLTGVNADVKDLTVAELTSLTVRDGAGNEDRIPTFAEYVTLAAELEMPLLIEMKLHGAETPDHVDLLIDELETLGLLERNMYHSLDAPSVARLKQLRPDLSVGYTMAFAAQEAPATPADFIVVEQWTASEKMQQSARDAGLGFWVWTVNDEPGYREYLRKGVDGMVSDRPDLVLDARSDIASESGLSGTVIDALSRWITVF